MGVFTDISFQLECFFSEAPSPCFVLDPQLTILAVNQAWIDQLGYSREEAVGQNLLGILPAENRDQAVAQFQALDQSTTPGQFRTVFHHHDGRVIPYHCSGRLTARPKSSPRVSLWVLFADQGRTPTGETEADPGTVQFQALLSNLPAAVSIKDAEENILFVNELFAAILGKRPQEIIGLHSRDITPPELQEQYTRENQRVLQGEKLREESAFPGPDGLTYWLTDKFPILNENKTISVGSVSFEITDKVKAEQALQSTQQELRESEQRFRMLAENARDIIALLDKDLKLSYLSPSAEDITGYSREGFQDQSIFSAIHPADRVDLKNTISQKIQNQDQTGFSTFRVIHQDGHTLWMEAYTAYFYDGEGALEFILINQRDVTQRVEMEQALRKSEQQKELILNSSSEMITYFDTDLQVIWANRAAGESIGKPSEKLIGLHCYQIWHQREQSCPDCPVLKAKETKSPHEGRQTTPDGRHWSIRGYPVLENGEVIGLVEFGQDITEQVRADMVIRESEARFRSLYQKTPVMLHSIDGQGRLIEVSDYWLEVMGYQREEVIGRKSTEFLTAHSREYAEQVALPKYFQEGSAWNVPYQFVTKSGEIIDVLMSAVGEWDQQGNFLRSLAVMEDVTQRIQAQRLLWESEQKYRRLIDSSPNIHYIFSPEQGALFWSQRVEDLLGYKQEDIIHDPFIWNRAIHPDDQEIVRAASDAKPGESFDIEYRIKDAEGNWHWFRDQSLNIRRENGGVVIEGLAADITEQKWMEIIQQIRLDLVDMTADSSVPELLQYALDESERITDSQAGFCLFLQDDEDSVDMQILSTHTRRLLEDNSPMDLHHSVQQAGIWADCIRQRQTVIYNDLLETLSGKGMPEGHFDLTRALIVPVIRNQQVVAVFGVGNKQQPYSQQDQELLKKVAELTWDVVGQQQTREDLRLSEKRYRGIVEDDTQLICRFDQKGELTFVNQAYASFFGRKKEELVGSSLFLLMPEKERERVKEFHRSLDEETQEVRYRQQDIFRDGSLRWVEWTDRVLFNDKGEVMEYQSVGYDIHHQVMLEKALKKREEEFQKLVYYLQEAREKERAVIARDIHDGFGQALTNLKFKLNQADRLIPEEAKDLSKKINQVIGSVDETFSLVRSLGMNLRTDMLDNLGLAPALEWHAENFSRSSGIEVQLSVEGKPIRTYEQIELDAFRVVQEALTNAARHARAENISIQLTYFRDSLEVEVVDDGIGFSERMVQESDTFGLISMRERVHRWEGDFMIQGEKGKGTTVIALFPLRREVAHD